MSSMVLVRIRRTDQAPIQTHLLQQRQKHVHPFQTGSCCAA
jgi:hypothetical protein